VNRVSVLAPAKLNPRLELLARRPDGMHEVRTTLLAVDLCDRVTLERTAEDGITVCVEGEAGTPDVPRDATNLAARAAAAVLERAGLPVRGLALRIEKRIPSQAGLGGGSSDAAAAALGAARLLDVDPDDALLLDRLAGLGADVPFFLAARGTGYGCGEGRGERITALARPLTARVFVVLTPRLACATAAAYRAVAPEELRGRPAEWDPASLWTAPLDAARAALRNDLEQPALRAHPELARLRRDLDVAGAGHFRLSGSGSSFFGLFDSSPQAEAFLAGAVVSRIARDHGLRARLVARPLGSGAALEG